MAQILAIVDAIALLEVEYATPGTLEIKMNLTLLIRRLSSFLRRVGAAVGVDSL